MYTAAVAWYLHTTASAVEFDHRPCVHHAHTIYLACQGVKWGSAVAPMLYEQRRCALTGLASMWLLQALFTTVLTDNCDVWTMFVSRPGKFVMHTTAPPGVDPASAAIPHITDAVQQAADQLREVLGDVLAGKDMIHPCLVMVNGCSHLALPLSIHLHGNSST